MVSHLIEGFEHHVFLPGKIKASLFIEGELNEELAILLKEAIDALIGAGSSEIFDILIFFSERTNEIHFNQIKSISGVRFVSVKNEIRQLRFVFYSLLQADILLITDNPLSRIASGLTNHEVVCIQTKNAILGKFDLKKMKSKLNRIPIVAELLSINNEANWTNENQIPCLAYFSSTHKLLFDNFFKPAFDKYLSIDFQLVVQTGEQLCSGEFEKGKWNEQVKEKVLFTNQVVQNMKSGFLLFSDVDIVFFESIKIELFDELGKFDMIFQNDGASDLTIEHNLCSGFYFCRINKRVKELFSNIVDHYNDAFSDQENFNKFLAESKVRYKYLSKRFFNFSYEIRRAWTPNSEIPFPDYSLAMYHANYTLGNENKATLLREFTKWNNDTVMLIKQYISSHNTTGISVNEAIEIANTTNRIKDCNMLVVKANIDKNIWNILNCNGYTMITSEHNAEHRVDYENSSKWHVVVLGESIALDSTDFREFHEKNNDNIDEKLGGFFFFLG